eukprot:5373008-Prymnesium_polylepis.1
MFDKCVAASDKRRADLDKREKKRERERRRIEKDMRNEEIEAERQLLKVRPRAQPDGRSHPLPLRASAFRSTSMPATRTARASAVRVSSALRYASAFRAVA